MQKRTVPARNVAAKKQALNVPQHAKIAKGTV